MFKRRFLALTLALTIAIGSVGCAGKRATTDPTQTPPQTTTEKFTAAAARANRVSGYAQVAHDNFPVFAGAVKLSPEKAKQSQEALLKVKTLSQELSNALVGIRDATLVEGKDRAKQILKQITESLKALTDDGFFVFPETEFGQKLEAGVRAAISLLPLAVKLLESDLL